MTEVAMHPISNFPSEELEENEVAFKVLNQDNLPISVIGESIFKPFDKQTKQKPNGIVYPTRRVVGNFEDSRNKNFTRSNVHINKSPMLSKALSISHGDLNHYNSSVKSKNEKNVDNSSFTKALDAKLKKLQREEKTDKTKRSETPRRPFITTVKKGHFLEPPPEMASLLGFRSDLPPSQREKKLYAYASQPRVLQKVADNAHQSRCETAARAAASIASSVVGVCRFMSNLKDINCNDTKGDAPMPYANLMFEKRVARGSNFAPLPQQTGGGESAAARAAEARRRAMARRKAQKQQVRGTQLRLGSPPPVAGRKHEPVQTDMYLEEIWSTPPAQDVCTQTDLFLERPVSPFYVAAKTGADMATQIYPGDLFDFDMEVQPILEVLVGKTIEQALIEVLEEEELAALREQQRKFLEIRAAETAEAQRLEERETRFQAEKERRISDYEEGQIVQKEMEERIAGAVLMQGYMSDLLPNVLEGLEEEGFLTDAIKKDVDDSFMPWLMKEVTLEIHEMVSSRDVLSDIVREILENRAELYKALNTGKEPGEGEEEEPSEPEEEEEGITQQDITLEEHMKLKEEIAKPAEFGE